MSEVKSTSNRASRRASEKLALEDAKDKFKRVSKIAKKKNQLEVYQLISAIKKSAWCVRVAICWELLWKRENKNYNEFGEWAGPEDKKTSKPWCVVVKEWFFWSKDTSDDI